jgi:hypothetical protein
MTFEAQKYGVEPLALHRDSPVAKGTKYTNGTCRVFPACDDPGTLRWGEGTRRSYRG